MALGVGAPTLVGKSYLQEVQEYGEEDDGQDVFLLPVGVG